MSTIGVRPQDVSQVFDPKYSSMTPDLADGLPVEVLDKMALHYEDLAKELRLKAATERHRVEQSRQVTASLDAWENAARDCLDLIANGMHKQSAIARTHALTGASFDMIEGKIRLILSSKTKEMKEIRDATIWKMSNNGMLNKNIAVALGLHPNTVSRAIQSALRYRAIPDPSANMALGDILRNMQRMD